MGAKDLLFSVTRDDFEWEYFCAGGPGGQNQNKVASACRCRHVASGVVYDSREHRDQPQNRRAAWLKVVNDPKFRTWLRRETARREGRAADIDAEVNRMMKPGNLRVEVKAGGRWVPEDPAPTPCAPPNEGEPK